MREIKFRLYSKSLRTLYTPEMNDEIKNLWHIVLEGGVMKLTEGDIGDQYTGLKDKNNKEIYTGDIVKMTVYVHDEDAEIHVDGAFVGEVVIIASQGVCIRNPMFKNNDGSDYDNNYYKSLSAYRTEIIGNIHENPELIKQQS